MTVIPHTQINLKCNRDLNVRAKTMTLIEENIEEKIFDMRLGKYFLNWSKKNIYTPVATKKKSGTTIL